MSGAVTRHLRLLPEKRPRTKRATPNEVARDAIERLEHLLFEQGMSVRDAQVEASIFVAQLLGDYETAMKDK